MTYCSVTPIRPEDRPMPKHPPESEQSVASPATGSYLTGVEGSNVVRPCECAAQRVGARDASGRHWHSSYPSHLSEPSSASDRSAWSLCAGRSRCVASGGRGRCDRKNGDPHEHTRPGCQVRAAQPGVSASLLGRLAVTACAECKERFVEITERLGRPHRRGMVLRDCMLSDLPARRSQPFAAQALGRSSSAFFQACAQCICKAITSFQAPAWVTLTSVWCLLQGRCVARAAHTVLPSSSCALC